ncbi:uncharacterized protein V3H82_013338 [Fundulus diaphanus]
MRRPSVSALLGVSVLLLTGLVVFTAVAYLPPFPLTGLPYHLIIFLPYCTSTLLLLTMKDRAEPGRPVVVSMEIARHLGGDQEPAEDYDDVGSCVVTVHRF